MLGDEEIVPTPAEVSPPSTGTEVGITVYQSRLSIPVGPIILDSRSVGFTNASTWVPKISCSGPFATCTRNGTDVLMKPLTVPGGALEEIRIVPFALSTVNCAGVISTYVGAAGTVRMTF